MAAQLGNAVSHGGEAQLKEGLSGGGARDSGTKRRTGRKRGELPGEGKKALPLNTAQMAQVRAPTSQMAQKAGSHRAHVRACFSATMATLAERGCTGERGRLGAGSARGRLGAGGARGEATEGSGAAPMTIAPSVGGEPITDEDAEMDEEAEEVGLEELA